LKLRHKLVPLSSESNSASERDSCGFNSNSSSYWWCSSHSIVALIGAWVVLHQRKPKPNPNPDKPLVGNHDSPSSAAYDLFLIERAISSYNQGRFQSALNYYQQALVIAREVGDRAGEWTILNNIGSVYHYCGQYDQALENFQQALVIHREVGNRAEEGTTLNNIGSVYHYRGQYDQALQNYQQALVTAEEEAVLANIRIYLIIGIQS
jgi:tetratricopeptide (TPR) repeat protein